MRFLAWHRGCSFLPVTTINGEMTMTERDADRNLFATALEMTEHLIESGYALLPETPTMAMLAAGAESGKVTLEQASLIYRAMHRIAVKENGDEAKDPFVLLQQLMMIKKMN
jgi:hypothetical protein